MPFLNDVHSRLNPTEMLEVRRPTAVPGVVAAVREVLATGVPLCVHGGRHAMGGQQFQRGGVAIDIRGLDGVRAFDRERGLLTIGAGAMWPAVIAATRAHDADGGPLWGIRQKQTGADDLTLAGSVSANAHGRGLTLAPIVDDIERLVVVTPGAEVVECLRNVNPELFSLVVGGYGLFGVIVEVTLRLMPRVPVRRLVDIIDLDDAMNAEYRRAAEGCLFGDFQYAIDPADDSFLRRGVMACYAPMPASTPISGGHADLPRERWLELLKLAHEDKGRAFQVYSEHYLSTHGLVYWSDTVQLSTYIPSYSEFLANAKRGGEGGGGVGTRREPDESLVIGEQYVPPSKLPRFMAAARRILREHGTEDIYGTIRSIRRDTTTFLPWARDDFACVIFNLRTAHTPEGIARTGDTFRALNDAAIGLGGSFFLTYGRWATREQVLAAHPRFVEFLRAKRAYDPVGVFQSDWYAHYSALFPEV